MYENTLKLKKNEGPSVTCSYIRHTNISKCLYGLDTYSVKIWWRYISIANAIHFTLLTYTKCKERYYFLAKKYVCLCAWYFKKIPIGFSWIWTVDVSVFAEWFSSNMGLIQRQGFQKFTKISVIDFCFIVVKFSKNKTF